MQDKADSSDVFAKLLYKNKNKNWIIQQSNMEWNCIQMTRLASLLPSLPLPLPQPSKI